MKLALFFLLSSQKMQRANKRHAEIRTTMFRNKQTNATGDPGRWWLVSAAWTHAMGGGGVARTVAAIALIKQHTHSSPLESFSAGEKSTPYM